MYYAIGIALTIIMLLIMYFVEEVCCNHPVLWAKEKLIESALNRRAPYLLAWLIRKRPINTKFFDYLKWNYLCVPVDKKNAFNYSERLFYLSLGLANDVSKGDFFKNSIGRLDNMHLIELLKEDKQWFSYVDMEIVMKVRNDKELLLSELQKLGLWKPPPKKERGLWGPPAGKQARAQCKKIITKKKKTERK